jgi:hypothetical protein
VQTLFFCSLQVDDLYFVMDFWGSFSSCQFDPQEPLFLFLFGVQCASYPILEPNMLHILFDQFDAWESAVMLIP